MTEQDVQANAEYMAAHLKEYGWEYVVVDIQWYAYGAGSMRSRFQYIPFSKLEMDEYSRLLPCPERFPSAAGGEIRMLHQAIQAAGRPIVLSLSPGPALIEKAWEYEKYANMWRITDDFWDHWPLLLNMFERCELWQNHVSKGCYPDCDMLPLGCVGRGFGDERNTRFTKEEQITMMTLWCVFRSPLMIGAKLPDLDEWTLSLLTNREVLALLSDSCRGEQIVRDSSHSVWRSVNEKDGSRYAALFNFRDETAGVGVSLEELGVKESGCRLRELWTGEENMTVEGRIEAQIAAHGAKLYRIL